MDGRGRQLTGEPFSLAIMVALEPSYLILVLYKPRCFPCYGRRTSCVLLRSPCLRERATLFSASFWVNGRDAGPECPQQLAAIVK